jgi:hypothetical protein
MTDRKIGFFESVYLGFGLGCGFYLSAAVIGAAIVFVWLILGLSLAALVAAG